jgi:hypothetical protein
MRYIASIDMNPHDVFNLPNGSTTGILGGKKIDTRVHYIERFQLYVLI